MRIHISSRNVIGGLKADTYERLSFYGKNEKKGIKRSIANLNVVYRRLKYLILNGELLTNKKLLEHVIIHIKNKNPELLDMNKSKKKEDDKDTEKIFKFLINKVNNLNLKNKLSNDYNDAKTDYFSRLNLLSLQTEKKRQKQNKPIALNDKNQGQKLETEPLVSKNKPKKAQASEKEPLVSETHPETTQVSEKEAPVSETQPEKTQTSEIETPAPTTQPTTVSASETKGFNEKARAIFKNHDLITYPLGQTWIRFLKGSISSDENPERQWKLFINPKSTEFFTTLDRTITALNSMPYINGKIISGENIKRKSDLAVLDDPCEPKLLLYFNGPNSAEDFKMAIKLLEKEFTDLDSISAPEGKRERLDGNIVPQWGPSFTKKHNNLMFYTQGGFTESGRHLAVYSGKLNELFEGENFYLHKGFKDPLEESQD